MNKDASQKRQGTIFTAYHHIIFITKKRRTIAPRERNLESLVLRNVIEKEKQGYLPNKKSYNNMYCSTFYNIQKLGARQKGKYNSE
jgi:hypothetical protein